MSKFKLYPWVEIFFVSLFTLLFYSLLQKYIIPRTYHSDVIWYLEAAFHNLGDFLLWVNRYAHVYFLKIFFLFSNDPFEVGKNYWVFMFTATTLLVYLNARLLTPRSKFLHGILAVGFFLSINVFSNTLGVPLVDYTSMLIVLTISLVYLSSLRRGHTVKWLLILLGFLFFIAFKTKETAWVSAILLFGLMFDENNTFNVESLKKNGLQVLIGGLIGGLLFIVLDGLLLKDPLFGLRPANLSTPTGFFINAKRFPAFSFKR